MKNLTITLLLLTVSSVAYGGVIPKKENADHRITVVDYSPDDVIRVRTKLGITTLIQLGKNETILSNHSGIGIGDKEAWDMSVKGSNIFLKPKTIEEPDTNLTVVTNKGRVYTFDLVSSALPYYIVKLKHEEVKTSNDLSNETPCYDGMINFDYVKWGDEELAPNYMWDDGRFTCLKFNKHAELPVAYQISTDGSESLINYSFRKDVMVIHSISKEFRLRLGEQVLGLRSEKAISSGYNEKATSLNSSRGLSHE